VFGDERAYLRFDMSEFAEEHSSARLLGAPPGYVGFDAGGELTNAVRQKPFSVVLFDEIEKAHPRILDKFLQILEDGRLTDGRGETAYFSETILVFTSNLGIFVEDQYGQRQQNVQPGESYETVAFKVREAIRLIILNLNCHARNYSIVSVTISWCLISLHPRSLQKYLMECCAM